MVSGLDLARAPRRARLTARKKGSGYENGLAPRPHTKALGTRLRVMLAMTTNTIMLFLKFFVQNGKNK